MLAFDDKELSMSLQKNVDTLNKTIDSVLSFSTANKADADKRFVDFFGKIQINKENITKLLKGSEDNKHF